MTLIKVFQSSLLKVRIYDTRQSLADEAARETAAIIKRLGRRKGVVNIVFAAAPSQNEFLEALAKDELIPWEMVNAFHMDEYLGLEAGAPQSFKTYLNDHIFGKVDFKSVNYIAGQTADPETECQRYGQLLQAYPTDIVCMGIGENGHIAFNDPAVADFHDPQPVKVVELDDRCRMQQVHDGCFPEFDQVPEKAITLTIPALMSARFVFCSVPGPTKAEAVNTALNGEITETCPASILKTHPNATLYLDRQSGQKVL